MGLNLALHRRRLVLDRNLGLLLNHVLLLLLLLLLVVMLLTVVLVVRGVLLILLVVLFGSRVGRSGSYSLNRLLLLVLVVVLLIVVRLCLRLRLGMMLLSLHRRNLHCLLKLRLLLLLLLNLLLSRLWIVLSRFGLQLLLRRTQRRYLLPLLDQRVGRSLLRRGIIVQHSLGDRQPELVLCLLQLLHRLGLNLDAQIVDRFGLLERIRSIVVVSPADVKTSALRSNVLLVQKLVQIQRISLHVNKFHPQLHHPHVLLVILVILKVAQTLLQNLPEASLLVQHLVLLQPADKVEPNVQRVRALVRPDGLVPGAFVRLVPREHRRIRQLVRIHSS